MELGQKIKNDVMIAYGSTKRCSEVCGISRNTLIKMYRDGIEGISHSSIAVVGNALGYDIEQFKLGIIAPAPDSSDNFELPKSTARSVLEEDLLEQFRKLSIKGQVKVLDYVNDLRAAYPSEV